MTIPLRIALLLVATGVACPAAAQVLQAPPGSTRGIFGTSGGTTTGAPVFAMTVDLDGGYDSNSLGDIEGTPTQFFAFQSGVVAAGAASARFQVGTTDRFLLGVVSGGINQQQVARGSRFYRQWRSQASLQAATNLGRRSGLTANVGISYDPTFVFGAFDAIDRNGGEDNPLVDDGPLPADPTLSLTPQRWLTNRVGAGVFRNWTSRQRMNLQYDGLWLRPSEGAGVESRTHSGALTHAWNPSPTIGLELVYRLDRWTLTQEDVPAPPISAHTAEARFRHERRLSPNRSMSFMVGGGAIALEDSVTPGQAFLGQVSPTVSGTVQLSFLPIWSVALGARRDVTVLGSLSSEPFESNSVTLSLDATPSARFSAGATAGYSSGGARRTPTGGFDQALVNARLQYALWASAGLTLGYSYNRYEFRDVAVVASAFPSRFSRQSVRLGLTFWLPLYGTF